MDIDPVKPYDNKHWDELKSHKYFPLKRIHLEVLRLLA